MRHTLLPLNERKSLRTEYRIRLIIVICFLVSLAGLVGVGSLFPAYMRARGEEQAQLDSAASLKQSQDARGITAMENELKNDNKTAASLAKNQPLRMSGVALSLIGFRDAVKLTSFNFSQPSTSTVTVTIQGTAPTRNDLLNFKSKLEMLPAAKVELPISELAKSTNIQFSMRITYKVI